MAKDLIRIHERPILSNARLVLGFSGWMDSGDVSLGTVEYLVEKLDARLLAEIDPGEFYIYNFPGNMEISSLFRPHTRIEEGRVLAYEEPVNRFYVAERHNLILFTGKEPNIRWNAYAACIFSLAAEFDVKLISFIGSVAGLVPHTREPRFYASASKNVMMSMFELHDLTPSAYMGPASILTYLITLAPKKKIPMINLVAETPSYLQGSNPVCIEAAVKKVAAILELSLDTSDLEEQSRHFRRKLAKVVETRSDLAEQIRRIEADYDKQAANPDMDELRDWFERQDIQLD